MILGVLSEQGGSLRKMTAEGQKDRFVRYYLENYAKAFDCVYYFSYENENEEEVTGLNYKVIPNRYNLHRWIYAFLMPILNKKYFKECDVFRVMHLTGEIPAILGKILYKKKIVATYGYHYSEHAKLEGHLFRPILFKLRELVSIRFFDGIIVTTEKLYDYISNFIPIKRITLIPNGVDTVLFSPSKKIHNSGNKEKKTIIYIGRFSQQRKLFILIEAVSRLKERFRILFIGDGKLKQRLKLYADRLGVEAKFEGVVEYWKIPNFLQASDIFVLPSLSEGHPKALLEAMSCGLACLASDIKAIREILKDGFNGLLFKLHQNDLIEKLTYLLHNEEILSKLGQEARNLIIANYDINRLIEKEINSLKETCHCNR